MIDGLRRFRNDELTRERELLENEGIISRFPQTTPFGYTGTKNGVRIRGTGRSLLLVRRIGGWPTRFALKRSTQYVRENSVLKLNLKLSTWIGALSIYSRDEITNFLFVRSKSRRAIGCTEVWIFYFCQWDNSLMLRRFWKDCGSFRVVGLDQYGRPITIFTHILKCMVYAYARQIRSELHTLLIGR